MDCLEREHLEREHERAGAAFDSARRNLQEHIGTWDKAKYHHLLSKCDEAWANVRKARAALDAHIRQHGCTGKIPGAAA